MNALVLLLFPFAATLLASPVYAQTVSQEDRIARVGFYDSPGRLSGQLPYASVDVGGTGNALMAVLRQHPGTSTIVLRLELVDHRHAFPPVAVFEPVHKASYFRDRIGPNQLGTPLKNVRGAADASFFLDLSNLVDAVDVGAPGNRFFLFEAGGSSAAEDFVVAYLPDVYANPGRRGQLSSPRLGKSTEKLVAIDPRTGSSPHLRILIAKVDAAVGSGWDLIGIGSHGLAFSKAQQFKVQLLINGAFLPDRVIHKASIATDEPSWMRRLYTRTKTVPGAEDRRALLVALSVCSKAAWHGVHEYIVNPGLWALPN